MGLEKGGVCLGAGPGEWAGLEWGRGQVRVGLALQVPSHCLQVPSPGLAVSLLPLILFHSRF